MPDPISTTLTIIGTARTIWELKKKISTKEPKLVIEKIYVANFEFADTSEIRRFVIAGVRNVGKRLAKNCMGYFTSGDTIESEYKLHWADTPYATLRNSAQPIEINPTESRDLDIAFSVRPTIDELGVKKEEETLTSHPIYAATGSNAPAFSMRGTFDQSRQTTQPLVEKPAQGSWIATPFALLDYPKVPQAYLSKGDYLGTLRVSTDMEKQGDEKKIRIMSPTYWDALSATVIEFKQKKYLWGKGK